jgi:hypothetical protein
MIVRVNVLDSRFRENDICQFTNKSIHRLKNILVVGCKSFELDESNLYIYHYCACGNPSLSIIVISDLTGCANLIEIASVVSLLRNDISVFSFWLLAPEFCLLTSIFLNAILDTVYLYALH